ncbi:CBS domain-containing protein [Allopseudospirillum japonicum]|uniref:CBS domain-containing protein n=1 Tax=Allopseudospirillum japonicum TaxID=64971 RepID=A0A1H6REP7_9GAMM|nr:CBS domain-containing protein [Allopseudospirillum japonicum]SEI50280.1 CBS domain-containing protein [Allopseudospirillum japonicum]
MSSYHALNSIHLADIARLQLPAVRSHTLTLASPAMDVVTDFTQIRPQTLPETASIDDALNIMKQSGVRLLLVLNTQGEFSGVVSALDLGSNKVTQIVHHQGVTRQEITVKQVMAPKHDLHGLGHARLQQASVGDVVETLKESGDQHTLVVDRNPEGELVIRGIISAADVSRALGFDLPIAPEARSFASICTLILNKQAI